jgi:hypothetical protein
MDSVAATAVIRRSAAMRPITVRVPGDEPAQITRRAPGPATTGEEHPTFFSSAHDAKP